MPEHVVTDKATFYPSAIRTYAPGATHTATGFYNLVISTNRCERNHGYVKSRVRPMRGLKSFKCATHLFPALDALQLVERDFVRVPLRDDLSYRLMVWTFNWTRLHSLSML
jgi:transposase, IS6 family